MGGNTFENSSRKKVVLVNIDSNASGNYNSITLKTIKKEIEEKGFSVVFGCFTRVIYRQCIMINPMVSGVSGNTTLFFNRESAEMAKFVQDEFSKTSSFEKGPIFEDYDQNANFSDDMKFILEKANVYISVDISH